ncbi:nuclear transport factor 2 family protein, partial [Sinomicrobium pectinilyticum]
MKTLPKIWIPFCCLLLLVCCKEAVQEKEDIRTLQREEIASPAEEKKEVKAVVELLRGAIIEPDATLLKELTADELTYGHSSGIIQDKDEFIEDLVHGPFDFTTVDFTDQRIVVSGRTAIVRHVFEAKATNAGT